MKRHITTALIGGIVILALMVMLLLLKNDGIDILLRKDDGGISSDNTTELATDETAANSDAPDDDQYEDGLLVVSAEEWFEGATASNGRYGIHLKNEPDEDYVLYIPAYIGDSEVEYYDGSNLKNCVKVVFPDGVDFLNLTGRKIESIVFGKISETTELDEGSDSASDDKQFYIHYPSIFIYDCPRLENICFAEDEGIIYFAGFASCKISSIDFPEKTIAIVNSFTNMPLLRTIELPEFLRVLKSSFASTWLEYMEIPENCWIIEDDLNYSEHIRVVVISAQNAFVTESFNGCSDLEYVVVEGTGTTFENCFDRSDNVTLVVKEDSAALEYAKENDISYVMYDEFDMSIIDEIKSESAADGE